MPKWTLPTTANSNPSNLHLACILFYRHVSVSAVKKPEHKVAEGALALAESMPDEEYTSIV